MPKYRVIHHLRLLITTTLILSVVGAAGGLLWLNQRGFEGKWGERIAAELSRHGYHADFESVRFSLFRGITAREVTVYADASREKILARIPRLRFDVDRTKALRGELTIRQVILEEADLWLPASSDESRVIFFEDLSGQARIDRQKRLTLEEATGTLGGMRFNLEVELDGFEIAKLAKRDDGSTAKRRDDFVDSVFSELSLWSFPQTASPTLDLMVTGSMRQPESIRTSFSVNAPELTRRDYTMWEVIFAGELYSRTLTIDRLQFSDGLGTLTARADYDLHDKGGRYELDSTIKIADLLRKALNNHSMDDVVSAQAPKIKGQGQFSFHPGGLSLGATGTLELPPFRFLGSPFEGLVTEFSWKDGNIFLRDLAVRHEQGNLTGQILMQGDVIRYRADSTLPLSVYRPLIHPGSGLDRTLSRSSFSAQSKVRIEAEGTIRRSNLREWASQGKATIENFSYNQVPLARAYAHFDINPLESIYTEVEADFDYTDYVLRRRHGGPRSARVRADRIYYDRVEKLTHVSNLHGTAWPAPVLRLFAERAANHIETTYRFHSPPEFSATGMIDLRKPQRRTDITTRMRAPGNTDYTFLGKSLRTSNVSSRIRTRYLHYDISDLDLSVFGGTAAGDISIRTPAGSPVAYSGGLMWNDLRLARIADAYEFAEIEKGTITGRIDFTGKVGDVRSLNGTGGCGLKNGELFFVPVFGPLSGLIGGVLGNKKFSHEEARDASATFVIKDGVAHSKDFLTSTPSTVFTGEGNINLATRQLDMTVRMNARGLLGLVTLPLRPFNGLFQFRGQGPLKKPVWRSAPFTQPERGPDDPVFRDPPRAVIVPEP